MNPPELFAITQPKHVSAVDGTVSYAHMTPEDSIVYMARVSSPNQRTEDSEKLLTYLVKHGHWSPFDMVDMTIEIETSRAIMAQILRHWSFRFQEFSQRYAAVPEDIDWNHVEARVKGSTNRQGSLDPHHLTSLTMREICQSNESDYQDLVKAGIAPESARMILPLATPTRAYMKGSVRTWMTYFWQRCTPHAQKEHRELAEQMFAIFEQEFPVIAKLVKTYKPSIVEQTPEN